LQEAARINTSLLTLRRCINGLAHGQQRQHVPFRDSKLTRILQNALGGSGRAAILCTINANLSELEEALSTLRFASAAATVSNRIVANVIERSSEEWEQMLAEATRTIRMLTARVDALESRAAKSRTGGGGGAADDAFQSAPPSELLCPLTGELFSVPVVAFDGRTYEKTAILDHFRKHGSATSPVDGLPMDEPTLVPNRCVAAQAARVRASLAAGWCGDTRLTASARRSDPWTLDELPDVVLRIVCSYLAPSGVATLAACCRRLYHEVNAPHVWDGMLRLHFGCSRAAMAALESRKSDASKPPLASPKEAYKHLWATLRPDQLVGCVGGDTPRWLRTLILASRAAKDAKKRERLAYVKGRTPHTTNVQLLA
jgi:hypothetical protein